MAHSKGGDCEQERTRLCYIGHGTFNYGTCVLFKSMLKAQTVPSLKSNGKSEHVHMTNTAKVACTSAVPVRDLQGFL